MPTISKSQNKVIELVIDIGLNTGLVFKCGESSIKSYFCELMNTRPNPSCGVILSFHLPQGIFSSYSIILSTLFLAITHSFFSFFLSLASLSGCLSPPLLVGITTMAISLFLARAMATLSALFTFLFPLALTNTSGKLERELKFFQMLSSSFLTGLKDCFLISTRARSKEWKRVVWR